MWYYSIDGAQEGPLDDAALDHLIRQGAVTAETMVWRDGMTDWLPLVQARPTSKAVLIQEAEASTCTMCGKRVGADNLIELEGQRVCAECKPVAVQSMREGAALPARNNTAWRDGKKVVAQNNSSLPARCYKCNHEVEGAPTKHKFTWHPSAYYLIVLFNLLVYVVVAMIVRKQATLEVYLCERHAQRRKFFRIGAWSGAGLGLVMIFAGIGLHIGWMAGIGALVVLAAMFAGLLGVRLATAAKIEGETVWLSGANKDFVASLPPWTS